MYLLTITIFLCITYGILYVVFPIFFTGRVVALSSRSALSVTIIFVLSLLGYGIALSIPDPEVSNRVIHGFGGGCMAMLVCFLVIKDTRLKVTPFQWLLISLLTVSALGVANEILEFILQSYTNLIFAENINDTWLDLVSNTIGSGLAALVFLPYVHKK